MPIPSFTAEGVLPPHIGTPTSIGDLSPYPSTTVELCQRFASSNERRAILRGLINYRIELRNLGFTAGFQWLDGSFLENIEITGGRPPRDLDMVTFFLPPTFSFSQSVATARPDLFDPAMVKATYSVDHYFVDMQAHPELVVEMARYWGLLFSHRRGDRLWKGMLRLELNTDQDDIAAARML